MRAREIALVAARDVREAVRSRWFLLAAASFLLLSLGLSVLGLAGAQRSGLAGFDRTTAGLLNLALLFVPLLGLSLGALGVAGELEDGSLATLLAQPLTRMEVFAGKYLGLLASHRAEEIERLADRVIELNEGRVMSAAKPALCPIDAPQAPPQRPQGSRGLRAVS